MKHNISLIAILFTFISCGTKNRESKIADPTTNENIVSLNPLQKKNAGLAIGKIEEKEMSSILKLNGKIDVPPENMVSISVPLGGYLKSTFLLPGMHVHKGEVIAVIQDHQYIQLQQDYLTAKSKFQYLENEFKRQKDLNQTKTSSDKVFQEAEAEYRGAQVTITSLREKLKLVGINVNWISETKIEGSINIYCPINGFVSKVNVNIGKYISPTEVLFEIVNPNDIHLTLKVFEKDLDKLYIGQKLVSYTNNTPGKKYAAEILLISKDLSPESNAEVHCHFKILDKSLAPGTYMNAEIKVRNKMAFVLPNDAIVQFEGKQYIFKVLGKMKFEMILIHTSENENGFTEIISPDHELLVESIVTQGAYSLLMMLKNSAD